MKKIILAILFVIFLLGLSVVFHNLGYVFLFSSNSGCTAVTAEGHWVKIINSETAQDITANQIIPVSKLRFKKATLMGCEGGL